MKKSLISTFCFFLLLPLGGFSATLTGPDAAEPGRLVTVESDVQGDWLVYPPDRADIAKDSGQKTLFLVAHQEGTFTVIFFGVEDLKPVISQKAIQITFTDSDSVPEPSPSPTPSLTKADKEAAIYALERVILGVETGSIKTANGCRSTFKQALLQKGSVCDQNGCHLRESLSQLTNDWTEKTDFTNAETVKISFQSFLKVLKETEAK